MKFLATTIEKSFSIPVYGAIIEKICIGLVVAIGLYLNWLFLVNL